MNWSDEAIVLRAYPHGETGIIATMLTREHGRHSGYVRFGASKKNRPLLELGVKLNVQWTARLSENLGSWSIEPIKNYSAYYLDDPVRLAAIASAASLIEGAMADREYYPALFEATEALFEALESDYWIFSYLSWELGLLGVLGFGIELEKCAATGQNEDLIYVSPKTGRAVSALAGEPYKEKLLKLPQFLIGKGDGSDREIKDGLSLTRYFIERKVFHLKNQPVPEARDRFEKAWLKHVGLEEIEEE